MADDTQVPSTTETPDKQGGGIVIPGAAAIIGAGAGGVAASHIDVGEGLDKKLKEAEKATKDAQGKYNTAEEAVLKEKGNPGLKANVESAKAELGTAENTLAYNTSSLWDKEIPKLKPEHQLKLNVARAEGEIKHLKSLPKGATRDYLIAHHEASIKAYKDIKGLDKLSPAKAAEAFEKAFANANKDKDVAELFKKVTAVENTEFYAKHGDKLASSGLAKVAEEGAKIDEVKTFAKKAATATKGDVKAVENAAKKLETAKGKWEPVLEKGAGKEVKGLKEASKLEEQLSATKSIVAEKGFAASLKRPIALLKEGTTARKLGIVGGAVALGAAAYAATRAMSTPKRSDSFVEQVKDDKIAAAAQTQSGPSA